MWTFKRKTKAKPKSNTSNPHLSNKRSFFSGDVDRLLNGWTSQSSSIDYYLANELTPLRARSRETVRKNPYGKRFITSIKTNIIGPSGVTIQAQSKRFVNGKLELDTLANDAIEAAYKDWGDSHADFLGQSSVVDLNNMAIASAAQDGEFVLQIFEGRKYGKYGFQLKAIDPELLDVSINTKTKAGEVRLGVEYDAEGRVIFYHFREKSSSGQYTSGKTYKVPARDIIHGFLREWPDQSRGVPWMHASLERVKHLDKYDEGAIVSARVGANAAMVVSSEGGDEYTGDEDGEGIYEGSTLDAIEPGTVKDIGNRTVSTFDPKYPHEMYDSFVKSTLRGISSGIGISYHTISNDLEGVNYSSIRAGVLEDREIFKGIQNWLIRALIKPVFERWLNNAVLLGRIKVGVRPLGRPVEEYYAAHYQARRWAWVDPQKDGNANQQAIENRTKSAGQVIRDQGGDSEALWREIAREQKLMRELGILPEAPKEGAENEEKKN